MDSLRALERWLPLLRHHAERAIGPRNDGIIRLDQALGEADRAARLDRLALHREPLPELRTADEIDGEADRRACLTEAREGMRVERQIGLG